MKRAVFLTVIIACGICSSYGQQLNQDANLNIPLNLNSVWIQQYGSDNKLLFLHRDADAELNTNSFNNLKVWQSGVNNTLVLSELKNNEINLEISQEGQNNRLFIHDVGVPMQIRQYGGMELTIKGTNFLSPQP